MGDPAGHIELDGVLGTCPNCEAIIPSGSPAFQYTPADGWPHVIAECPRCFDAVHPT